MQVLTPFSRFPGLLMALFTITVYAAIGVWLVSSIPEVTYLLEAIKSGISSLTYVSNPLG